MGFVLKTIFLLRQRAAEFYRFVLHASCDGYDVNVLRWGFISKDLSTGYAKFLWSYALNLTIDPIRHEMYASVRRGLITVFVSLFNFRYVFSA